MHILVSNDDGIFAPGIAVLAEAAGKVGKVTVVSPDREQSGTSHSLTLHRPLRPRLRHDGSYQVDGTPTDCVLLAVGSLMPERPKFVFSGVNHGPNMGEDVLYSGTVSVAMEAVTLGIPAAIFTEAGLSFLGFGINDPLPSWGKMVADSNSYIRVYWHLGLFPTLIIAITMLSFSFVGDGLRDALDPHLNK